MFFGYNTEFLFVEKSELPQYQFAEVINLETEPTLLNYGFLDGGFYTVSGVDPSTKYFFEANMELEEMKETQKQMIHNGAVEFVVTMNETYDWENYEQVAEASWRHQGRPVNYYLYQLK